MVTVEPFVPPVLDIIELIDVRPRTHEADPSRTPSRLCIATGTRLADGVPYLVRNAWLAAWNWSRFMVWKPTKMGRSSRKLK